MTKDRLESFMRQALIEAEKAAQEEEVPIGAIIVWEDQIIARSHNQREANQDPTAHAEILAIKQAASYLGSWRLIGTTMFVTIEPCVMCAGALVLARVDRLVYGASDPRAGAVGSLWNIVEDERLNHRIEVISGILAEECSLLLRSFFQGRRGTTSQ